MNIEIHKPELEALILQIMKTEPSGTIEDVLFKALKGTVVSSPPSMSVEERLRLWEEWTQSHADDDAPLLSDEAVSRASFYSDRW